MHIKKLTIIVAVYNESPTLDVVYTKLKSLKLSVPHELIFVDDGSTDGSKQYLIRASRIKQKNTIILFHTKNKGKGAAIRTALDCATGDYVIFQDADLEYNPDEIQRLVTFLQKKSYRIVYGSRNKSIRNKYIYPHYYWGSRFHAFLIGLLFRQQLTDLSTCYKLLPTDLLRFCQTQENGFGIEVEFTTQIARLGLPIAEVSISYTPRTFSQGKKINAADGIKALYLIIKYRVKDLHFDLLGMFLRARRERSIYPYLNLKPSSVVLDLGCGKQANLGWSLRTKIKQYIGVDLEVPNIMFDKIVLRKKNIDELKKSDIHEKVDNVVALAVIEHVKYPEQFVNLSRDLLKKGGRILVTTPHPKTDKLLKLLAYMRIIDAKEIHDHKQYFTVDDLRKLFTKCGFRVIHTRRFLFGMNGLAVGEKI